MEFLSSDKGILIHTSKLDSAFMLRSLQSLLDIQPDSRIACVYNDRVYGGFKVYFEESKSLAILERKYISVSEERLKVYPLTTFLSIHDVCMKGNEENILRCEIAKKFGEVLSLCQSSGSIQSFSRNWRAEIAVPEKSDLSVFERNGFPTMSITLPSISECFKITFWCRRCKKDGHIQQDCPPVMQLSKPDVRQAIKNSSGVRSFAGNTEILSRKEPALNLILKNALKVSGITTVLESTEAFARKLGAEEIMKVVSEGTGYKNKEQESKSFYSHQSSVSNNNKQPSNIQIKKEVEEDKIQNNNTKTPESPKTKDQERYYSQINRKSSDAEKEKESSLAAQNDDKNPNFPSSPSSDDDDIQIVNATEDASNSKTKISSLESKMPLNFTAAAFGKSGDTARDSAHLFIKKEDNLNETNSSTFNRPTFADAPGPSNLNEINSPLSPFLRECFKRAYEDYPCLNSPQLEAFLTHVKKKSNPIRVAGNYTMNVLGLKSQLSAILAYYYNTAETGTKYDIQYVKWLKGLVDRFEGTPQRKRKRASDSDERNPKKK